MQAASALLEEFGKSPDGTLIVQFAYMRLENYLKYLKDLSRDLRNI
ncbi:MAG: hypothetical protein V3U49_01255 [Nitrososphaerales archaeon]